MLPETCVSKFPCERLFSEHLSGAGENQHRDLLLPPHFSLPPCHATAQVGRERSRAGNKVRPPLQNPTGLQLAGMYSNPVTSLGRKTLCAIPTCSTHLPVHLSVPTHTHVDQDPGVAFCLLPSANQRSLRWPRLCRNFAGTRMGNARSLETQGEGRGEVGVTAVWGPPARFTGHGLRRPIKPGNRPSGVIT